MRKRVHLLSIEIDDSVAVFQAELTVTDPKFWTDDEITHETLTELKKELDRHKGHAKHVIAVALMAKYGNPDVDFAALEEKAGKGYACRLLDVYSEWIDALREANLRWRGKDKRYSDQRRCDLKVRAVKHYEK